VSFIKSNNRSLYCDDEPIILRGFGLGGWLLPEGYMWKLYNKCDRPRLMEKLILDLCGSEYADYF
jgi:endoglucanase